MLSSSGWPCALHERGSVLWFDACEWSVTVRLIGPWGIDTFHWSSRASSLSLWESVGVCPAVSALDSQLRTGTDFVESDCLIKTKRCDVPFSGVDAT